MSILGRNVTLPRRPRGRPLESPESKIALRWIDWIDEPSAGVGLLQDAPRVWSRGAVYRTRLWCGASRPRERLATSRITAPIGVGCQSVPPVAVESRHIGRRTRCDDHHRCRRDHPVRQQPGIRAIRSRHVGHRMDYSGMSAAAAASSGADLWEHPCNYLLERTAANGSISADWLTSAALGNWRRCRHAERINAGTQSR